MSGQQKVIRNYADAGPSNLWAIEQLIDKLLLEAVWDDQKPQERQEPEPPTTAPSGDDVRP